MIRRPVARRPGSVRHHRRVASLAVAVVGAVATGGCVGDLGCPSQSELERPRTADEVLGRFAQEGVELHRTTVPRDLLSGDPAYGGARAYRHVTRRGALYVLVCRARCVDAPGDVRSAPVPVAPGRKEFVRRFATLGNNVALFVTGRDRRSAGRLQALVQPALDDLDAAVPYGSRCYEQ